MKNPSTKGLSGLDASDNEATDVDTDPKADAKATKSKAPKLVRPSAEQNNEKDTTESEDEIFKELENRIEDMEKRIMKEEDETNVPTIKGPEIPTKEQVERHNATHANFKSWCVHCQKGLAMRDKHTTKKKKKDKYKR